LNFIEEGILDSLDIVFLATYLEEKFSIKIDITDDNILKTFSNFENIVKLVS
jgi:acyl carrier protein